MGRIWRWGLGSAVGLVLVCAAGMAAWLFMPLTLRSPTLDLAIEPGTSVRQMSQLIVQSGVDTDADWLWLMFRLSGQSRQLKAGNYELQQGVSPYDLLKKIATGDEDLKRLTVVEGWTLLGLQRPRYTVDACFCRCLFFEFLILMHTMP